MTTLPFDLSAVFVLITLLTAYLFFNAANRSVIVLFVISGWLSLQAIPSLMGFYTVTDVLPPRFILLIGPPLVLIICLFTTKAGKKFIDKLDLHYLTLLHTIRIVVELVLLWLFYKKMVPEIMTFEGYNFDILSGFSALIVFYLYFVKRVISSSILLIWNLICLALLINIVTIAILSAPFPFQQLAFEQPNKGVLYFPLTWLPAFVVPVVLLSHLATIRRLVKSPQQKI